MKVKQRAHIRIPGDLLREIDDLVGPGGRSVFFPGGGAAGGAAAQAAPVSGERGACLESGRSSGVGCGVGGVGEVDAQGRAAGVLTGQGREWKCLEGTCVRGSERDPSTPQTDS